MSCKKILNSEQSGLISNKDPLDLSLGLPEIIIQDYLKNNCSRLINCLDFQSMTYHNVPDRKTVQTLISLYQRINPQFDQWYKNHPDLKVLFANGSIQLHLLSIMACYNLAGRPATFKIYIKTPYFFLSKILIDDLPGVEFTDDVNSADMEILISPNNPNNEIQTPSIEPGKFLLIDAAYNSPNFVKTPFWYGDFSDNYRTIIISTASKMFGMAAQRVGWAFITDPEIYENLYNHLFATTNGYNGFSITLVIDAMKNYDKTNNIYQLLECRYRKIVKICAKYNIQVLSPVGPFAWLGADFDIVDFFLKYNIIVNSGSNFGTNNSNCRLNLMVNNCTWKKFINKLK